MLLLIKHILIFAELRRYIIMKGFLNKYGICFLLLPWIYFGCQDCDDCGPSQKEPYVILKFFNIDSLLKVEDTLAILNDSLVSVEDKIEEGDTTLYEERDMLQMLIARYEKVENNINQGKIRIESVSGNDGQELLLFRDSTTNDTLRNFRFPLDMNSDQSLFKVNIQDQTNEIRFSYNREIGQSGSDIVVRALNLELLESSFDSAKINCKTSNCFSNETVVDIFF